MTRIGAEEAARLWHEASDDELKELAQRPGRAGTSPTRRRT